MTPDDLLVDAVRLALVLVGFGLLMCVIALVEPVVRAILEEGMTQKFDRESLRKLKEAVDSIPPQTMPRAVKNVEELKAAIKRLERENSERKMTHGMVHEKADGAVGRSA